MLTYESGLFSRMSAVSEQLLSEKWASILQGIALFLYIYLCANLSQDNPHHRTEVTAWGWGGGGGGLLGFEPKF